MTKPSWLDGMWSSIKRQCHENARARGGKSEEDFNKNVKMAIRRETAREMIKEILIGGQPHEQANVWSFWYVFF